MLDPITPDSPAGTDIGFEPEFEEVQAEVGKLESLSGAVVDWKLVADRSAVLLAGKAKDFRLGSWHAAALLHEEGYGGLARGLNVLAGLVDGFWETGFPLKKRLRARINMFEWLSEHTARSIQDKPPPDPDAATQAAEDFRTFKEKLDALLADKSPGMNDLQRTLSSASSSSATTDTNHPQPAPEAAPSPDETPVPDTAPVQTTAPPEVPDAENSADNGSDAPPSGEPQEYAVDWVAGIAAPFSGERPGGEDVTFHPDFEALEAQTAKLGSVHGDQPDWNEVVRLGKLILSEHSKELRAAGPLALGLLFTEGLPGAAQGLAAYDNLLRLFWDDLWPAKKRMRGRLAGIEWVCERIGREIEKMDPASIDREHFQSCFIVAERLHETAGRITEGKADGQALLASLRTKKEELNRIAPAPVQEPKKASKKAAPSPVSPPSSPATPAAPQVSDQDLGNADDVLKKLKDFQTGLKRMGSALRSANPADPTAYRLMRTGAWLSLNHPPPAQSGKTRLPPPPKDAAARLEEMAERNDFSALLDAAETRFSDSIFWLDAQRYVHQAMAGLGAEYDTARRTVAEETAALIRRVPELAELSFSSGIPFADGQTRMWIETEVTAAAETGTGPGMDAAEAVESEDAARFAEAAKQAKPLAAEGKLAEALRMMQDAAARSSAGRGRFLGRLMLAGFCREIERFDIGLSILAGLETDIEHMRLMDWEPALCVRVFNELVLCEQGRLKTIAKPSDTDKEGVRRALDKLCRLDAAAALKPV